MNSGIGLPLLSDRLSVSAAHVGLAAVALLDFQMPPPAAAT
jgi:hypothetical protein